MLLPLVITEFVKTIECSVSLAITAVDMAGVSRSEMLFVMATEITSPGKGCSTAYVVAFKTVGIGVRAGVGCDDAGGGNTQDSWSCDMRLSVDACETIHSRSSGG